MTKIRDKDREKLNKSMAQFVKKREYKCAYR